MLRGHDRVLGFSCYKPGKGSVTFGSQAVTLRDLSTNSRANSILSKFMESLEREVQ